MCYCETDAQNTIQRAVGRGNEFFIRPKRVYYSNVQCKEFSQTVDWWMDKASHVTQSGGRYPGMPLLARVLQEMPVL